MRFIADGPSIPDELLLARDQGRVVFFCGAGISRAKAKLPDFFGLAETVTKSLGVHKNDPAMRIIAEAREIGARTGVDGLISADRVFGLLERDFLTRDVQEAVAKALKSAQPPDLSAHQTMLRLATTRQKLVRLVTTNFDRLFDACRPDLPTYISPRLPDPGRPAEFNGVVYLHGKIAPEYDKPEGDGFVLSSSEFGKAYLSDGWATSFIREILNRYFVVFVGYSADDPPIQYLLEALASGPRDGIYAFQSGDTNYATSRWRHKGVSAIAYESGKGHSALWDTLEAWAERADDPDAWVQKVVNQAKGGPAKLRAHERGQVAHIVSTVEGVRRFAEGEVPPPASWLCVFDPSRRYAKPGKRDGWSEGGPVIDPFDLFSLDTDLVPNKADPDDHYAKREMPKDAWDAFAINKLDKVGLRDDNIPWLRGHSSVQPPRLPTRQSELSAWISKISCDPATVWWAARQVGLHADTRRQIQWWLERPNQQCPDAVRKAWGYLFEFWSKDRDDLDDNWHVFASRTARSGWNAVVLRQFADLSLPYMKVRENFWGGPVPPEAQDCALRDLLNLDVEYPDIPDAVAIPEDWLVQAIAALRRSLELALELETEIGGYGLSNLASFTPDTEDGSDAYARQHGLSASVLYFLRQMKRLLTLNQDAAKRELSYWQTDDPTIFARLRIWALSEVCLVPPQDFPRHFDHLPDEAFWDSYHSRDLLSTLRARWGGLSEETQSLVQQRLVAGPPRWPDEDDASYGERQAWATMNRLTWLSEQGCRLTIDLPKLTAELSKRVPKWKPEYAREAAESLGPRTGWVRSDIDRSGLESEPLISTLAKAQELSGRRGARFVDHNPFAGLSKVNPVRAFAALRLSAKKSEFPEWAWRTFLSADCRKDDRVKFSAFIGEQLSRYPAASVASIARPVADWFKGSAKGIAATYPGVFAKMITKVTDALALYTSESGSAIVRGSEEPDWTTESINAPAGILAQTLFQDPQIDGLEKAAGLPDRWKKDVERLLSLPGDLRRHSIVIFAYHLNWLFYVDPSWTKAHLLSVLAETNEADKQALWAGFLWSGKASGAEFFELLKPHMLRLATSASLQRRGHTESLVGLVLSAWAIKHEKTQEKWVTDDEFRDILVRSDDSLRTQVLWRAEHWAKDKPDKWAPLLIELLTNVWPRQRAAKSAAVSARLCDIAFSDEGRFLQIAAAIEPLLTKADGNHLILPNLRRSKDNIVDLHPRETLALLHAILPDQVSAWPYGVEEVIKRIGEADNALNADDRLLELKRKWDSR